MNFISALKHTKSYFEEDSKSQITILRVHFRDFLIIYVAWKQDRTALLFLVFPAILLTLRSYVWDGCLPAFPVQLYQVYN